FNHDGPNVIGIAYPHGNRVCMEYDDRNRPQRVTQLPAPGQVGEPQVAEFTYDERDALIEEVYQPQGGPRSGRHYARDQWERIVAVGEQVDALHARWTCFGYADAAASSALQAFVKGRRLHLP